MEDIEEKEPNLGGRPRRNKDVELPPEPLPMLDSMPSVAAQLNLSGPTVLDLIRTDPEFAACFIIINKRRYGVRPKIAALIERRRRAHMKSAAAP